MDNIMYGKENKVNENVTITHTKFVALFFLISSLLLFQSI
jgi:hypothetical protein